MILLFVLLAGGTAAAKPLPASQHEPPLTLNLQSLWVTISTRGESGYVAKAELTVMGVTSKTDRLRFDWKSGNKVIASAKCEMTYYEASKVLDALCETENETKVKGPINIDVIYTDDQDDKEYLVTTLKTEVRQWKGIGKFQNWGLTPDDLLSVGFVFYSYRDNATYHRPNFQFWTTNPKHGPGAVMRCTVDGKKLPDFDAHIDNPGGVGQTLIESGFTNEKEQRKYTYAHVGVDPGFYFGTKEAFKDKNYDLTKVRMLSDNPGKWDCMLRVEGKPLRQFLFTVNDKGMIEPSEMQKGPGAVPTVKDVVLIDMKIPKENGRELRLRQDAMKKSIGFGIPWPDSPKAKELQAAFPPSMGLPD